MTTSTSSSAHTDRLATLTEVNASLEAAIRPLQLQLAGQPVLAESRPDAWTSVPQLPGLRWRQLEGLDPATGYVLEVRALRGARGNQITTPEALTMNVVAGTMLVHRPTRSDAYQPFGPAHPSSRCELVPGELHSWIISEECQCFNVFQLLKP